MAIDPTEKADLVCLGAIAGAHGVRGDLKVKTFTADPLDLAAYGILQDEDGSRLFEIMTIVSDKIGARIRVRDITSRDLAHSLKGTRLYVPRERLPALETEDDFYYADLVGLKAVYPSSDPAGMVVGVHNFGSGDLLEIAPDSQSFFVPFTKACVPEVNIKAGHLVIDPPTMADHDPEMDEDSLELDDEA
ncbi:MAG: ribosome maturation factor RimM [Parvibaculales bacterium]